MLLPSNCDGPGGGQCFVLLVTLITPWWIQLSLFLLICPLLSASCSFLSSNYCVYAYLRHAVQEYRLSGGNYAKTDKCPVKQVKLHYTRTKYVILIPTTCKMKTCSLFKCQSSVVLFNKESQQNPLLNAFWMSDLICLILNTGSDQKILLNQGLCWYFQPACHTFKIESSDLISANYIFVKCSIVAARGGNEKDQQSIVGAVFS